VRSTDHEAPHYVVFSAALLTSSLLGPNIFLTILFVEFIMHRIYGMQNVWKACLVLFAAKIFEYFAHYTFNFPVLIVDISL
jgi:hypothetical protein